MTEKTLNIEGMHCEHCVASVTKALEGVGGTRNVSVSLADGKATLEAGVLASDEKLIAAVEEAGFKATVA